MPRVPAGVATDGGTWLNGSTSSRRAIVTS